MNAPVEFRAVTAKQLCQRNCGGGEAIGIWKGKWTCARCLDAIRTSNGRRDPQSPLQKPGRQSVRWASTFGPLVLPNEGAGEAVERRAYVPDEHPRMAEYIRDYRSIKSLYNK